MGAVDDPTLWAWLGGPLWGAAAVGQMHVPAWPTWATAALSVAATVCFIVSVLVAPAVPKQVFGGWH